jgi:hypothetical protein
VTVPQIPELTEQQRQRFLELVIIDGDCWNWAGSKNEHGYGRTQAGKRRVATHRLMYKLANDADPGDKLVLHKCDNTLCCNPSHLFLGTYQDNNTDCATKGRKVRTHVRLTPSQARLLKRQIALGGKYKYIAEQFNVSVRYVQEVAQGRMWKNLSVE